MSGSSATAGTWALILMVYMLSAFGFFYVMTQAMASHNGGTTTVYGLDGILAQQQLNGVSGVCQSPRNADETGSSNYVFDRASLSCAGIPTATEGVCSSINGCSWLNETYYQFVWAWPPFTLANTGDYSCQGNVSIPWLLANQTNVSLIDDGTNSVLFINASNISTYQTFVSGTLPYIYAAQYEDTVDGTVYTVNSPLTQPSQLVLDVCDMPRLASESVCAQFGCTWKSVEAVREQSSALSFGDVIAFMFGFNIVLDKPVALNLWFSLLFVWLPLIALLVTIVVFVKGF